MGLVGRHGAGEAVEIAVIRMNEGVDGAEGEVGLLPAIAEEGVHRVRPVDPAPRDVPVPQAAIAAAERRFEAQADLLAGPVGQRRLPRLQAVGDADADDHEDRGPDEDDLVAGPCAPADHQRIDRLKHGQLAPSAGKVVRCRQHPLATGQAQEHSPGTLTERREWLARPEDIGQRLHLRGEGRMRLRDLGIGSEKDEAAARMPGILRQQPVQVGPAAVEMAQGMGSQASEALHLGLRAGEDLRALATDVDRRQRDEAGQEDRERAGYGIAQPALRSLQTWIPAADGPNRRQSRVRTRGEGSGNRLRHGRTSPLGNRSGRGDGALRISVNTITQAGCLSTEFLPYCLDS